MEDNIVNKVASSGLVTIDLEEFYPKGERVLLDIKPWLFQELILREKEFREFIKQEDWAVYKDKLVAVTCSSDAIIPTWAYMLVAIQLQPFATRTIFGNLETLETVLFEESLKRIDFEFYRDKRIVIKGCSKLPVPINAYVHLANSLRPLVKSMMYGEPCSTVPLYKVPK